MTAKIKLPAAAAAKAAKPKIGGATTKVAKPSLVSKRRVEETEPKDKKITRSAEHSQVEPPARKGWAEVVGNELWINGQMSELVPVAQYASVTIGPVQIGWKMGGIDMAVLSDVNWDVEDGETIELTDEQLAVYQKVRGAIRSTMAVLEHVIAEDREAVERSVRKHNEREAEKQKASARKGK